MSFIESRGKQSVTQKAISLLPHTWSGAVTE